MSLLPEGYGEKAWACQAGRLTNLRNLGFQPKQILDIGAHHGFWAGLAKHIWPAAELFCIEANEDCRLQLVERGFPFEIALLDATEREADYYKCTSGCSEGNGLYKENSEAPFEAVKTLTRTLDNVVAGRQFDFIKLDCQGAELDVLNGGRAVLSQARLVQMECQVQQYNQKAPLLWDVIEPMYQWGFRPYDIIDFHYNSVGLLIQIDMLFARSDNPIFQVCSLL